MRKGRPNKPMGSGNSKSFSKSPKAPLSGVVRPTVGKKPVVVPRPASVVPRRGASPARVQARQIKREALNQIGRQDLKRPAPTVRPSAPPVKIMPRKPLPMPARPPIIRPGYAPPAQVTKPATGMPKPTIGQGRPKPSAPVRPASVRPATSGAAAIGAVVVSALNTARAHPQISNEVMLLNSNLTDLQNRSSLSEVQSELMEMDSQLNHLLGLLESARDKGYVYQKDLDETAYHLMDQWQPARESVLQAIPQQSANFRNNLLPLNNQVNQLNRVIGDLAAAQPLLSKTASRVNQLLGDVSEIERSLRNSYANIRSQASKLTNRLNVIHWALTQLSESKSKLNNNEKLIMAVQGRWDQEGDEDPEGVLYLTNQRLIFEQKEKVARKKLLFLTVDSEFVQEVLIDQPLSNLQSVKASNKGLFGNQDFVEVLFSEKKLGEISFHIEGQESTYWATLIEQARTGEIQNDQTTGSGLSYADLTGPITTADILAIQNEVNDLQDLVTLKAVGEEIAAIENDTRMLTRMLSNLRNRGYLIEKSLEMDLSVLEVQWDRVKTNSESVLEQQTSFLREQLTAIQKQMADLAGLTGNLTTARPLFLQLKSSIASLEAQADAADDAVIAQYDEYANEVEALTAHMEWVGWMLDALSTASFKLLSTESGVAATEAVWERPGTEPENGIIYLTDQRLLWEDRVDTFELEFELPVVEIQDVKKELDETSQQEYLRFTLSEKALLPLTRFQLALPVGDAWLKMIGRARSGDYATDRAVEIDQQELDRIRNAPRQCSNCGAGLTNTILRGQTSITCEYCGTVIPI